MIADHRRSGRQGAGRCAAQCRRCDAGRLLPELGLFPHPRLRCLRHIYQDGLQFDSHVQLNVELYGLEQVEVMKGPSSALYGQGPLGGLINLVSKHPRPETFLTLGADYGSFDSYELHLDANTTLFDSPNIAGRLVALTRHSGTFTEYAKGNDRIYVAPSLTWTIDPDTSLTVLTKLSA
jgi:iron complex outermembrane receptor protein